MTIRPARHDDLERCRAIEVAAGTLFRSVGMDAVADDEPASVDPAFQRRGHCRALLDEVTAWAAARSMPAVTLTTFRDVPWNAPLYAHLGFAEVPDPGPELAAVMAHEAELGLAPALRVAMRRPVTR